MIIYGALVIPFAAALILYFYFRRLTTWWELFLPLIVSLILIVSMKAIIEKVQVTSKEYWGSFVQRIEYYEEWNEWITQTCTSTCCCDDKGNNCQTTIYDCSYCLYHAPEWRIITTTNEVVYINQTEYARIKSLFGNEAFRELGRDYYTIDGDEYHCTWNNDSIKAVPVTTLHHYENRVKAADQSVFHFEKVEEADIVRYQLKEYPPIQLNYKMTAVLGDSSEDARIADKKIQYINGLLGHKKEVKVFILVFKNQPIEAAFYQEWYWSGGNMNEFVVCIGIDNDRNIKWCKPISWTTNEMLKVETKNFVINQTKLNLRSVADHLQNSINKSFERRNFKEFDYLTVEPPLWAIILCYVLTLGANIGVSLWVIRNEMDEAEEYL